MEIIIAIIATWILLHFYVYDHKSQIKRLWKEIFKYAHEIGKFKKMEEEHGSIMEAPDFLIRRKDRTGKLINALLDYHYSDSEEEEDLEYINGNSY